MCAWICLLFYGCCVYFSFGHKYQLRIWTALYGIMTIVLIFNDYFELAAILFISSLFSLVAQIIAENEDEIGEKEDEL